MNADPRDQYPGMTINERLFVAGLMERWDIAVRARDREAMIATLHAVGVATPQNVVDAVLANPERHGL